MTDTNVVENEYKSDLGLLEPVIAQEQKEEEETPKEGNTNYHHHHHLDHEDVRQGLEILLKSTRVLINLASMDTTDYQASLLLKNSSNSHHQRSSGSGSVCHLQKTLEDLQRQWPPHVNLELLQQQQQQHHHHQQQQQQQETTARNSSSSAVPDTTSTTNNGNHGDDVGGRMMLQLCTCIHRFHGTINNLQNEIDALSEQLEANQARNEKLEKALIKLSDRNRKLVQRAKLRSQEKRSLVKHIQDYIKQVRETKHEKQQLVEENEAYRLRTHEQFLLLQRATRRFTSSSRSHQQGGGGGGGETDDYHSISDAAAGGGGHHHFPPRPSPPRSRGLSSDSNFSDLDGLDFHNNNSNNSAAASMDGGGGGQQRVLDVHVVDDDDDQDDEPTELSCFSDDFSAQSVSSLVTAEGIATLRLSAAGSNSICSSPPGSPPRAASSSSRSRAMSSDSNTGGGSGVGSSFGIGFLGWNNSKSTTTTTNNNNNNNKKEEDEEEEEDDNDGGLPPPILTISFPSASSIGLQFEKTTIEKEAEEEGKEIETDDVSREGIASPPTPTMKKRAQVKGLLDDAIAADDLGEQEEAGRDIVHDNNNNNNNNDTNATDENNHQRTQQNQGFHLKWNVFGKPAADPTSAIVNNNSKETTKKSSSPSSSSLAIEMMFVVCGFVGFDDSRGERPNLGDKLVAVNGEPVNGKWSLEELDERLRQAGAQSNQFSDEADISNEEKKCTEPMEQEGRVSLSFQSVGNGNEDIVAKITNEDGDGRGPSRFSFRNLTEGGQQRSSLKFSLTSQSKKDTNTKQDGTSKMPKMPTFTTSLFKSSSKDEEEAGNAVDQDDGKETNETIDSNAPPRSATNIMHFLSPQSYYHRSASASAKKTDEMDQAKEDVEATDEEVLVDPSPNSEEEKLGDGNDSAQIAESQNSAPTLDPSDVDEAPTNCENDDGGAPDTNPPPRSATNIMQFLSPQSYYHRSGATKKTEDKVQAKEDVDASGINTEEAPVDQPRNSQAESSGEGRVAPIGGESQNDASTLDPSDVGEASTNDEKDGIETLAANVAPRSATNIMHFLSPQSYYHRSAATSTKKVEEKQQVREDTKASYDEDACVSDGNSAPNVEADTLVEASSAPAGGSENNAATLDPSKGEDETKDVDEASDGGDKFMKSVGNMFKRPFG